MKYLVFILFLGCSSERFLADPVKESFVTDCIKYCKELPKLGVKVLTDNKPIYECNCSGDKKCESYQF